MFGANCFIDINYGFTCRLNANILVLFAIGDK